LNSSISFSVSSHSSFLWEKRKQGSFLLETVYPSSDLVDFPTFRINIAIPRFVYGIQRVEKEETAGDEEEYWNRKQGKRLQIVP